MSSLLSIEVDTSAILAALDRLGPAAEAACRTAAHETAQAVQREARVRARRRTGTLAEAITIEEASGPLGGYRVFVAPMKDPAKGQLRAVNFPLWHEFGTQFMSAQPFLFAAARLEEGAHRQRIVAALQAAIDEGGLG